MILGVSMPHPCQVCLFTSIPAVLITPRQKDRHLRKPYSSVQNFDAETKHMVISSIGARR